MSMELRARAAIARLSAAGLAFNPDQKRGHDGRWIKMGGGLGGLPGGGGPSGGDGAVSEEDDELYRELRSEYGWNLHQVASDILRATRERSETDPDPRWPEADPQWEPGDGDPVLQKLARNLEWDLEDQPELADAAMELLRDHIEAEYLESVASLPEPPQRGALAQLRPRADASDGFDGALATRAEALTAALSSGVAAQKPLSAGFMGDTRMLTLNDGSQVVYKRAISTLRPGDLNWEVKDQTDAEHLSSLLAGAIGAPAPVVHRLNDAELAMELVSGRPASASALTDVRTRGILATDDAVRIGLLDVLLNNTDRHGGNWMVDDTGGPVAIDHGMAFAVNPPAGTSGAIKSPFATEHFINPDGTFQATNGLTPSDIARLEEGIERIRPQFERAARTDWLDAALGRLRQLGERARGPASPAVTAGDAGGFGMRARVALAKLMLFGFNPGQKRGPDGRWIKMGGRGSAGRRGTPGSGSGPRVTRYARGEVKETPGTTPGAHSSYAFTSDGRTRTVDLPPDRAREVAQLLAAGQDAVILEGSPRAGGAYYSRIEMQAGPAADDPVRLTLWPPGGPPGSVEIEMTKRQARELADRMRANAAYRPQKPLAIPGQPQYAARVKRLQASVASGVRSEQRVGMGIMGRVDRVQHNDGTESIRKEALGGSSAVRDAAEFHTEADQNAAEELSGLVAAALGMRAPVATPTSATESYIELMPGVPAVTKLASPEGGIRVPAELGDSPSVRRMAVLDLLIDNGDRNTGNWLVDGDEAIPIDHGMAFAPRRNPDTTAATGPFSAPYITKNGAFNKNNPLTPRDVETLRARIDSLRPQFAERDRASWLDQMMHRLDLLAAGAKGTDDIFSSAV